MMGGIWEDALLQTLALRVFSSKMRFCISESSEHYATQRLMPAPTLTERIRLMLASQVLPQRTFAAAKSPTDSRARDERMNG